MNPSFKCKTLNHKSMEETTVEDNFNKLRVQKTNSEDKKD